MCSFSILVTYMFRLQDFQTSGIWDKRWFVWEVSLIMPNYEPNPSAEGFSRLRKMEVFDGVWWWNHGRCELVWFGIPKVWGDFSSNKDGFEVSVLCWFWMVSANGDFHSKPTYYVIKPGRMVDWFINVIVSSCAPVSRTDLVIEDHFQFSAFWEKEMGYAATDHLDLDNLRSLHYRPERGWVTVPFLPVGQLSEIGQETTRVRGA